MWYRCSFIGVLIIHVHGIFPSYFTPSFYLRYSSGIPKSVIRIAIFSQTTLRTIMTIKLMSEAVTEVAVCGVRYLRIVSVPLMCCDNIAENTRKTESLQTMIPITEAIIKRICQGSARKMLMLNHLLQEEVSLKHFLQQAKGNQLCACHSIARG